MRTFISGLEEVVARLCSLVLTLVIFVAYTLGSQKIPDMNWQQVSLYLFGFWFVYEFLGYILFVLFKFFAAKTLEDAIKQGQGLPPTDTTPTDENKQNPEN